MAMGRARLLLRQLLPGLLLLLLLLMVRVVVIGMGTEGEGLLLLLLLLLEKLGHKPWKGPPRPLNMHGGATPARLWSTSAFTMLMRTRARNWSLQAWGIGHYWSLAVAGRWQASTKSGGLSHSRRIQQCTFKPSLPTLSSRPDDAEPRSRGVSTVVVTSSCEVQSTPERSEGQTTTTKTTRHFQSAGRLISCTYNSKLHYSKI